MLGIGSKFLLFSQFGERILYLCTILGLLEWSFQIVPVFKLSITVSLKHYDQFILLKIDLHGNM